MADDAAHALTFSQLAQLAHDIKGPLARVALETQVLQTQLDDGDHIEMAEGLVRMLRNIDYIDRMVHDLIDACAIDNNRFSLHRRPTELCELLENVSLRLGTPDERGRIVLIARDRITVTVDPLRIERVVANLLDNALVYSQRETVIVVKLALTSKHVRVSVTDSGPGIARGELTRVFEEFRRGPAAAATHDGYGLGLFVSKQIIEAHGGEIGVNSAPGTGSEFYFDLPLL